MARRSGSWWAVMLGLTALVAGCGDLPPEGVSSPEAIESGDELEGEPDQWWLVDATPDRQLLELTTRGGGCSEFAGWVSETNDDRVRVEARWEHAEADDCPAVLRTDTLVLDLDEPLGDRDLVGCRTTTVSHLRMRVTNTPRSRQASRRSDQAPSYPASRTSGVSSPTGRSPGGCRSVEAGSALSATWWCATTTTTGSKRCRQVPARWCGNSTT
jgi:hypothetical protein